jgi:LPS-assembly lipoprotein
MLRRPLLATALLACALTGCGFELRRTPELHFSSIALAGFAPRSPLAEELRRLLQTSPTTRIVEAGPRAQVVLEALADTRQKSIAATTAFGQVRELQLRSRLSFRLRTPAGQELIPVTEIALSRDMSYSETAALAKEQEEAFLFRAMEADIAQQVLRRLAAVRTIS